MVERQPCCLIVHLLPFSCEQSFIPAGNKTCIFNLNPSDSLVWMMAPGLTARHFEDSPLYEHSFVIEERETNQEMDDSQVFQNVTANLCVLQR